jgi:hypothetical protein
VVCHLACAFLVVVVFFFLKKKEGVLKCKQFVFGLWGWLVRISVSRLIFSF